MRAAQPCKLLCAECGTPAEAEIPAAYYGMRTQPVIKYLGEERITREILYLCEIKGIHLVDAEGS